MPPTMVMTAIASYPGPLGGDRATWCRPEFWLAGGLVLMAFSWLPLSYYRMVG
jgi:hypothetical protein